MMGKITYGNIACAKFNEIIIHFCVTFFWVDSYKRKKASLYRFVIRNYVVFYTNIIICTFYRHRLHIPLLSVAYFTTIGCMSFIVGCMFYHYRWHVPPLSVGYSPTTGRTFSHYRSDILLLPVGYSPTIGWVFSHYRSGVPPLPVGHSPTIGWMFSHYRSGVPPLIVIS